MLLLYQTQAKEFQVINVNLAAAAKEAGLSSYVNNDEENVEDEKKDRVLLAQLVEAAKGRLFFIFVFNESIFISFSLIGALPVMIYNLSTTKEMKQQLEPEFRTWMANVGTSQPEPAWFINGEFVVTKLDKWGAQIKLGNGGSGEVLLSYFLDAGVAKKKFHQDEDLTRRKLSCAQLRHPNIIRLLGASAASYELPALL